jgi:integrase
MNLKNGRQTIIDYINGIIKSGITSKTVRSQVGILSRYFSYVLEHPYVKVGGNYISIIQLYGPIDQPVSEYDIPCHSYDGEQLGIPLDPESLYDFFYCLKEHYLVNDDSISAAISARNYTMAVIAAESGLRADELLHLELSDLFFESYKIQTRFAKGTRGSGKRARTTLFTLFARDTVKFYISKYRHLTVCKNISTSYLFPNKNGFALDYTSAHKALRDMIAVAQENHIPILNHMGWHWFRRIFATRFIERFPHQLSALVELLGHTSPNTVHRYIRHSEAWMDTKILQILEESS